MNKRDGALTGLTAVEVGSSTAAGYCGKLLADFGARVIKVEPPGGDPLRRTSAPQIDVGAGVESGFAAWLNTNKESVVVDNDDQSTLLRIIDAADILIDAGNPVDAAERHALLRANHPSLTILSLSWFGETGPYASYSGSEIVVRALAGLGYLTGPQQGPPEILCEAQSGFAAGLTGLFAVLAARLSTEPGRRFELSVLESNAVLAEYEASLARAMPNVVDRRYGRNRFRPTFPLGIYRCSEGWIGVTIITPDQWRNFCELLEIQDAAADPKYLLNANRFADADQIERRYAGLFMTKTAEEWFALGRARRLPFVVVPDVGTLLTQNVHRSRGAWGRVRVGSTSFEAPAAPYNLAYGGPSRDGRSPMLGEHTSTWADFDRSVEPQGDPPKIMHAAVRRPLEGLRIVDLTMGWAGPLATRMMADLGADIVKIEGCSYPDWWRGVDHSDENVRDRAYEKTQHFNVLNRNKRGVAIDLTSPDAVELVKMLVRDADAVIENYSFGVLPKLGLDYAALRAVNPSIVMLSMPAFGAGPWADVRAYGSTLEQASGLPTVSGNPDTPPMLNQLAYGDPIGGLNGAVALLIGLTHQRRTGVGQHIELSQVGGMLPLLAPWIIEHNVAGRALKTGNRHPVLSPHGCYQCAGEDGWIALAVTDDAQWEALCRMVSRLDLADLTTAAARREAETIIDAAISDWTSSLEPDAAMDQLQAVGVPAGVLRSPGQLEHDPHLTARGAWQRVDRPWLGEHIQPTIPIREEGRTYPVLSPSPTVGQHNREILGAEGLALSEDELRTLMAMGVIGDVVIPVNQRTKHRKGAPM